MPVFGDVFTPLRVRILFAITLSFIFVPLLSPKIAIEVFPRTLAQLIALAFPEAMIGMAFGLIGRLLFAAVQFAGNVIGEEIGFGMASIMDPSNTTQIPIVAELLYVCSLMVFFCVNGHHIFFTAFALSFTEAPPGMIGYSSSLASFFITRTSEMFFLGVQMSLPIVAAIFATNVALGMVAKAIPQVNVFLEGFPVRICVGLFLTSAIIGFIVKMMIQNFSGLETNLNEIFRLMARQ